MSICSVFVGNRKIMPSAGLCLNDWRLQEPDNQSRSAHLSHLHIWLDEHVFAPGVCALRLLGAAWTNKTTKTQAKEKEKVKRPSSAAM